MYSQEFKEKILRRYDETHKLTATCREFNISRETLQRWRKGRREFDEEMWIFFSPISFGRKMRTVFRETFSSLLLS